MKQSLFLRDRRAVAFAAALAAAGVASPAAAQSLWDRIISPFQTQRPQPAPAPVQTAPAPAPAPARTAPAARQAAPGQPVQILPPGSVPNVPAGAPPARAARPAPAPAAPTAPAQAEAPAEPSWPARLAVLPPPRPADGGPEPQPAPAVQAAAPAPEATPAPRPAPVVTAAVTPTVMPQVPQAPLTERGIVERANAYFTNMTSMVAEFTQIGADGRRMGGTLFLQRPGRLRFDYDPPATMQVIADGSNVAVRDRKLATQDLYFISQTPLKFLLRERVNLGEDIRVTGVQNERDGVRISLEDRSTLGGTSRITLYFDPQVENLQQWRITDAQGFQTTVILSNVQKGRAIDQSAFKIEYNNPISDNNR